MSRTDLLVIASALAGGLFFSLTADIWLGALIDALIRIAAL